MYTHSFFPSKKLNTTFSKYRSNEVEGISIIKLIMENVAENKVAS